MTDTLADIDLPAPGGRLVDLPFVPVRIAVLTISDTRDEESDTSGKILADRSLSRLLKEDFPKSLDDLE